MAEMPDEEIDFSDISRTLTWFPLARPAAYDRGEDPGARLDELKAWAFHHSIIGFTYEADVHCVVHAAVRFGADLDDDQTLDNEGNFVHRIYRDIDVGDPCNLEGIGVFADKDNPTGSHCSECIYESVANRPGG